ncbi:MAG TPA: malto-oligosyltrehalose synthase [Dermatophilaceae bacterium]|nr:malto-oligosyltrehalose synthase [Dermatophilaceae bacterium]
MPDGRAAHRPPAGRVVPSSTYRLQLQPGFTFADAMGQADYLAALGVSHVYLSPILQSAVGSTHGYDVVDHQQVSAELGGREGFEALAEALRARGLGVVVDVVPNHMTVPVPEWRNAALWSMLREGRDSPHASWFDVDWESLDGQVLMPVLGGRLEDVLAAGELLLASDGGANGSETVLRYHDHEFPVRPGTEKLPLTDLVARQAYRLSSWRETEALNYRRFFDVTSLIAVRVEDPEVFDATHGLLLELVGAGQVDGLRIDHPDGLADPQGYLAHLADATGDAWVVAEKILEGDEELQDSWRCAGTTGYDTLLRVQHVFVDPDGADELSGLYAGLLGDAASLAEEVVAAKQQVVDTVLVPEVERLLRLLGALAPDFPGPSLRRALAALLVSMDRYRAYSPATTPAACAVVDDAVERAGARVPDHDHPALAQLRDLVIGRPAAPPARECPEAVSELGTRFEQTCGPVMAKGVEDTAFYRYTRLTALNEVGGDPAIAGIPPEELHAFAARTLAAWPTTMTTLSTHDTKRSEDVRARLAALAERPAEWAAWVATARDLAAPFRRPELDAATEYLVWQTMVGAWPVSEERLRAYAVKAVREAKRHTTWTDPDPGYESAVAAFVSGLSNHPGIAPHVERWVESTAPSWRATLLGQKLLQLVLPGVPDVYQGSELVDLSLVDPDNRRLVDFAARSERLSGLRAGRPPEDLSDEKLLVTSLALELRRAHPEWFIGTSATYEAVPTSSQHALALARGDGSGPAVVAVATRFPHRLEQSGGWADHTLDLPSGQWRDLFSRNGSRFAGGVRLADVFADLPVALLVRITS